MSHRRRLREQGWVWGALLCICACSTGVTGNDDHYVPWSPGDGTTDDAETETEFEPETEGGTDVWERPPPDPDSTTGDTTGAPSSSTTDEPSTEGTDGSEDTDGTDGTDGTEDCGFVLLTHLDGLPLNVRSAPSVGSALVGTMHEGQVVEVLAEVEGQPVDIPPLGISSLWYEVDDSTLHGFVTSLYTECTDSP